MGCPWGRFLSPRSCLTSCGEKTYQLLYLLYPWGGEWTRPISKFWKKYCSCSSRLYPSLLGTYLPADDMPSRLPCQILWGDPPWGGPAARISRCCQNFSHEQKSMVFCITVQKVLRTAGPESFGGKPPVNLEKYLST